MIFHKLFPLLLILVLSLTIFTPFVHAQTAPWQQTVPWQKTQLLTPTASDQAVSEPSVMYENGVWRMWYRVGWTNLQGIFYANSTDGIHWTKYGHVTNDYNAHVIRYNSTTLLMYAHGLVTEHSIDGIHWYNYTQPYGVLPNPWLHQPDPYSEGTIGNSEPLKLPNGTYLMYYDAWNCKAFGQSPNSDGSCYSHWAVYGASSPDGIHNWVRMPSNPLVGGIAEFANPNVVYQNGVYYAFIDVYDSAIYIILETSTNGFSFSSPVYDPLLIMDVEKKSDPNCDQVGDAWVIVRSEGIYLFYDEDANAVGNFPHASIWLALLPNTTLAQLVAGQFGANISQADTTTNVSEGLTPLTLYVSVLGCCLMLYFGRKHKMRI